MTTHSQGTKLHRNIYRKFQLAEWGSQTTDGRAIAYSEHEREFTFAKNYEFFTQKTQQNTSLRQTTVEHMGIMLQPMGAPP